mmetsp:Transcript_76268/g.203986  ORF Transcript_76268/g.203986 Transcript_76268/m.203986 type:complete len:703 (+) Transcript_76268:962-3070(+)
MRYGAFVHFNGPELSKNVPGKCAHAQPSPLREKRELAGFRPQRALAEQAGHRASAVDSGGPLGEARVLVHLKLLLEPMVAASSTDLRPGLHGLAVRADPALLPVRAQEAELQLALGHEVQADHRPHLGPRVRVRRRPRQRRVPLAPPALARRGALVHQLGDGRVDPAPALEQDLLLVVRRGPPAQGAPEVVGPVGGGVGLEPGGEAGAVGGAHGVRGFEGQEGLDGFHVAGDGSHAQRGVAVAVGHVEGGLQLHQVLHHRRVAAFGGPIHPVPPEAIHVPEHIHQVLPPPQPGLGLHGPRVARVQIAVAPVVVHQLDPGLDAQQGGHAVEVVHARGAGQRREGLGGLEVIGVDLELDQVAHGVGNLCRRSLGILSQQHHEPQPSLGLGVRADALPQRGLEVVHHLLPLLPARARLHHPGDAQVVPVLGERVPPLPAQRLAADQGRRGLVVAAVGCLKRAQRAAVVLDEVRAEVEEPVDHQEVGGLGSAAQGVLLLVVLLLEDGGDGGAGVEAEDELAEADGAGPHGIHERGAAKPVRAVGVSFQLQELRDQAPVSLLQRDQQCGAPPRVRPPQVRPQGDQLLDHGDEPRGSRQVQGGAVPPPHGVDLGPGDGGELGHVPGEDGVEKVALQAGGLLRGLLGLASAALPPGGRARGRGRARCGLRAAAGAGGAGRQLATCTGSCTGGAGRCLRTQCQRAQPRRP